MSYAPEKAVEFARPRYAQLSDSVASYIRELIMSGEVRGGEYLRVDRIAQASSFEPSPTTDDEGLTSERRGPSAALR